MHYVVSGDFVSIKQLMGQIVLVPKEENMGEVRDILKDIHWQVYGNRNSFSVEFVFSITLNELGRHKQRPTSIVIHYRTNTEESHLDSLREKIRARKELQLEKIERDQK